jgi:hypothetical protein
LTLEEIRKRLRATPEPTAAIDQVHVKWGADGSSDVEWKREKATATLYLTGMKPDSGYAVFDEEGELLENGSTRSREIHLELDFGRSKYCKMVSLRVVHGDYMLYEASIEVQIGGVEKATTHLVEQRQERDFGRR